MGEGSEASELLVRKIRITAFAPDAIARRNAQFVRSLNACDLIVVNGEGTIHHERPDGYDLLEVAQLARDLDIPGIHGTRKPLT